MGQLLWSWRNGTKINNTLYPLSDPSVCEQMSWPLTYDDGINLRAKPCEEESHFVCEIQCKILLASYQVILFSNAADQCGNRYLNAHIKHSFWSKIYRNYG